VSYVIIKLTAPPTIQTSANSALVNPLTWEQLCNPRKYEAEMREKLRASGWRV